MVQQGQVRQELKRIHHVLKLRGNLWTGENSFIRNVEGWSSIMVGWEVNGRSEKWQ